MQQGYKKIKINKKDSVLNEQDMAVDIGTNITRARLLVGYTQKELAKEMKTTQPSLARYERGSQMPSNRFLIRIAKALNTNVVAPTFESLLEKKSKTTQYFGSPTIFSNWMATNSEVSNERSRAIDWQLVKS